MNILLVNGHEYWESSPGKLTNTLVIEAQKWLLKKEHNIKITVVEDDYDLEEEVQKILWADVILYFSPVYWMSITGKLKSYFDHVYEQGKGRLFIDDGCASGGRYGTGGLMQDKRYMLITTWNAPFAAFSNYNRFLFSRKNVDDVFLNFHSMQKFIGMQKLDSFALHDVKRNPNIKHFLIDFKYHLEINIRDNRISEIASLL